MDLEQAAHKAAVKEEKLQAWEEGTEQPTIKQLRTLGEVYRRPLAVFFLPETPRDFQVQSLKDFRRLAQGAAGGFSPALRFEIRRGLFRREVALELFQNIGTTPPPFQLLADLNEDPEVVGARLRGALGITLDRQRQWQAQGYSPRSTPGCVNACATCSLRNSRAGPCPWCW